MDDRNKQKNAENGFIPGNHSFLSGAPATGAVKAGFAPTAASGNEKRTASTPRAGVFEVSPAMQDFALLLADNSEFPNRDLAANEIRALMEQVTRLDAAGAAARGTGNEVVAEEYYREALSHAITAGQRAKDTSSALVRLGILRVAAGLALHCGEAAQARQIIKEAYQVDPATAHAEGWMQLRDVTTWPDAWLIATVRREPPDEAALDALVERYWKVLFGRCQMLTLNQTNAADLAQEAWRRVLRTRHRLNPGGRFGAYLITIATNLWRDSQRAAGRAGPMALNRLASLDDTLSGDEQDTITLMDVLPDLQTAHEQERRLLAQEIDHALGRLTPLLREVLTARFLSGESCAEIGRRHGRTEQTISGWVRAAIQQMKFHLAETSRAAEQTNI